MLRNLLVIFAHFVVKQDLSGVEGDKVFLGKTLCAMRSALCPLGKEPRIRLRGNNRQQKEVSWQREF